MTTVLELQNNFEPTFQRRVLRDFGTGMRNALRGWRVYGNIQTTVDSGGSLVVAPGQAAREYDYALPLPSNGLDGAGFCELAIDGRVSVDTDQEHAGGVRPEASAVIALFMRSGTTVQWISLESATSLVVRRSDGTTQASETQGALPASASSRWQVAMGYDDSGTFVRVRAFEDAADLDAWDDYRPSAAVALPAAPDWFGLSSWAPTGLNLDRTLTIHSLRIMWPENPARWYYLGDVPGTRPKVANALIARKNRVATAGTWSRDGEATADSSKTAADETPCMLVTLVP